VYNRQSVQPWVIPQLNYVYAITPRVVNNFILNGNWYSAVTGPANFDQAQSLLPTAFSFTDGGANGGGFAGVGPSLSAGRRGQQLGIIDDLSWSLRRHTIQPVSMIAITESPTPISPADRSLARTPLRISAILRTGIVNSTGKGSTFTQSFPLLQTVHTRLNSLGFYVQDEWKIRRNLNLTYGVRFELQGNPSCKEGCYSRPNTTFLGPGYQAGLAVPTTRHCKQGCIMTSGILKALCRNPGLLSHIRRAATAGQ
jgi:hypothetical protein